MKFTQNLSWFHKWFGALLALGLVASGCSENIEDGGGEPRETAVAPVSGEYVPASAEGPAQNVPEPRLPAVVTENSAEGAEAALEFFWEAAEYLRLTGDSNALALISDETCHYCESIILDWALLYEEGQWVVAPDPLSIQVKESVVGIHDGYPVADVYFQLTEPRASVYSRSESFIGKTEAHEDIDWIAMLDFDSTAQQWKMDWIGPEELLSEEH